jgi:hypothetical protein
MADDPITPEAKPKYSFPWYYVTRAIGTAILLFGVFADHTGERGTIILTGAGLLGIDKVARSETAK